MVKRQSLVHSAVRDRISWFCGGLILAGLVLLGMGLNLGYAEWQFRTTAAPAEANLLRKWSSGDPKSPDARYYIEFEIPALGRAPVRGSGAVDRATWAQLEKGSTLTAYYIRGVPLRPRLSKTTEHRSRLLLLWLSGVGLTSLGAIALAINVQRLAEARLKRVADGTY